MKRCSKCLLPGNFPEIDFDKKEVCNFCRDYSKNSALTNSTNTEDLRVDFEQSVEDCRGKGRYDCLVCVSGGKDSTYLAYLLSQEYRLKVLGFTCDTGFLSDIACKNISNIVAKLGIDHIFFRPRAQTYQKMYSYLFSHLLPKGYVYTICSMCATMMDHIAIKIAIEKQIPLIILGYSPNQPEGRFYDFSVIPIEEEPWFPRDLWDNIFDDHDKSYFWTNSAHISKAIKMPRILAPLHILDYDADVIVRKVEALGLIQKGKASPLVTNCLLNWPMMYLDMKRLGYNPYIGEFSSLIREGKLSRQKWIWIDRFLKPWFIKNIYRRKEISFVAKRLNIDVNRLSRINEKRK